MAFIRGLEFQVEDSNTLILVQRQNMNNCPGVPETTGCASRLTWSLCLCKYCNCVEGYVDGDKTKPIKVYAKVQMNHAMKTRRSDGHCSIWFNRVDKVLREYTTLLRAALLAKKLACCGNWMETYSNKVENLPCYSKEFDTHSNLPQFQARRICGKNLDGTMPAEFAKDVLVTKPTVLDAIKEVIGGVDMSDYEDVTKEYISLFHKVNCTRHAYASKSLLKNPNFRDRKMCESNDGSCVAGKDVAMTALAYRIMCVEKDYPAEARNPIMGPGILWP